MNQKLKKILKGPKYFHLSRSQEVINIWICIKMLLSHDLLVNSQLHLNPFLAHLSWKLKWAFLITCRPSSGCPSVCPSVCLSVNFSHFHLLLQNHWANFNQTWYKVSLGEGDSSLFKWRATPSKRGDNWEKIKINYQLLKFFFSRTTGPISTKLGQNHSWVKGILIIQMKDLSSFQGEMITK